MAREGPDSSGRGFFSGETGRRRSLNGAGGARGNPHPLLPAPGSESWWDVPVAEVAKLDSTRMARKQYEEHKMRQRPYFGGTTE